MPSLVKKTPPKRRTASKEERRGQLIRATIRSVAKNGLSDTTVATVAKEAKLSVGIINLHFQSKDRLLVETLRHVAAEYRLAWRAALDSAGDDPAEKLACLVEVDFDRKVCDRNNLAVWFAFWGESKSRPIYRQICADHDQLYQEMMTDLCAQIVADGPYPGVDAASVATGLSAMSEGLWLDLLVSPGSTSPEQSKGVYFAFLASLFPRHFGALAEPHTT
jgi:TetR/AcrR family transcriptional repressor of bet genes